MIIVLDTSMSMRGAGGSEDIFWEVLRTCKQIVMELHEGDTVTLITFDQDVSVQPTVTLMSNVEIQRVKDRIDEIEAEGEWTYTSKALMEALEEADRLEGVFPDHTKVIVILTDGINDPPPGERDAGPSLMEVATQYAGKPWYVYQVQLSEQVDEQLAEALGQFLNSFLIHYAEGIDRDSITEAVTRPEPAPNDTEPEPTNIDWTLSPEKLTIDLYSTDTAYVDTIKIVPSIELPHAVIPTSRVMRANVPDWIGLDAEIESTDGHFLMIVTASADSSGPNGEFPAEIHIESYSSNSIRWASTGVALNIASKMVAPVWPYWIIGIIIVCLIGWFTYVFLKRQRERQLFGTLLFWPKGDRSKTEKVDDLSTFGKKVRLGSEIAVGSMAKDVAVMMISKVEGTNLVTVYPVEDGPDIIQNSMTHLELPLYNSSEFEIGDWHFLYRGPVPSGRKMADG